MRQLLNIYRQIRIRIKQLLGIEPRVPVNLRVAQEFHGSKYGGWSIPTNKLSSSSVIVDIGLGEDISFSTSLIDTYKCNVHGFDPTPRAIEYVEKLAHPNFQLHKFGIASEKKRATFYLPNNELHVSGTLIRSEHTGHKQIEVNLISLAEVSTLIESSRIDLLKLDIEGAEFELLMDPNFSRYASQIDILCIEFHHRWSKNGIHDTNLAVKRLTELGFDCIWVNPTSNEEFTFVRHSLK